MSFYIGNVCIPSRAVLAPMAGMSDSVFRTIAMKQGAGMVTSELLSANAIIRNSEKTYNMLPTNNEPRPSAAQIFGGEINVMRDAAVLLDCRECDIIDLNYGCPVSKVTKTGGGAAVLKDFDKAVAMAKAVVSSVSKPVTVKIRIGWDRKSINAIEMVHALEDVGVACVTIHGRTVSQGYSGLADWAIIKQAAKSVQIPIIGNGDIRTASEAVDRLNWSGCAAVMLGRGALSAPWLFRSFNDLQKGVEPYKPSPFDIVDLVTVHFKGLVANYSEKAAVKKMRTWLGYYSKGFAGSSKFREMANKIEDAEALKKHIAQFFGSVQSN